MKISFRHLHEVCLPGRGKDTCRYITCGSGGFECAKHTGIGKHLDNRVAQNTITAQADNCGGREKDLLPDH